MPIFDPSEAKDLDEAIQGLLDSPGGDGEKHIREIFVEKLDFSPSAGVVDLRAERCPINQATRIAESEGVHVVWASLEAGRVLVSDTRAISKALSGLVGDHLLVASNDDGSVWQFIYPVTAAAKPVLRRIVVERGLPGRTFVTQLAKVYHDAQTADIRSALESAYNVEPVTKEFFRTYRETFDRVMAMIRGVPDAEERRLFCQMLFNRLMFLYFLQRKGWLKFEDDPNYLPALLRASKAAGNENFFRNRLKVLFFTALNNPDSRDVVKGGADIAVGDVPFLNGGLFEEGEIDRDCAGAEVPNEAFEDILGSLFERFNFTVSENTPYDIEVAVDPEMLGKIFEELVTGRHETGSYYTPRPVVAFMCREALKGYLETKVFSLSAGAIKRFVDEHNVEGLDVTQASNVAEALDDVTVCDPACGSGAYLVGMLHELIELKQALYSEKLGRDPTRLYDMKLHVIERNLYGADIDQFAINIAMLRLWLSLIIDFDGDTPPPLPNLDFKMACGDSLTAPSPLSAMQQSFRGGQIEHLLELRSTYMTAHGRAKSNLRDEIEALKERLAEWAHGGSEVVGVDWPVEFAEAFIDGGFDIVLANPPYVRADAQFKHMRPNEDARQQAIAKWKKYRATLRKSDVYETLYEKWDLYIPFLERAYQLLRPEGQMVFIISDAYNAAKYALRSQEFFLANSSVVRVDFCTDIPLFEAGVTNTILHIRKNTAGPEHVPVRARRWGQRAEEFGANVQLLSSVPQAESGLTLFRPDGTATPGAIHGTTALGMLCYISYGLRANADDRYWQGAFTTNDCLSPKQDAVHTKPFVQGKDLIKWHPWRISYLEWGTDRAPSQFSRPTFSELQEAKEKLIAVRTPGKTPKVIYDNKGLHFDASSVGFVPWHQLRGVRNRSIRKKARYRDEAAATGSDPAQTREDLEAQSRGYDPKFLLAVMNSSFAANWLASRRRSKIHIYPDDWKRLPIPMASKKKQEVIVAKVEHIHGLYQRYGYPLPDGADAELATIEAEIDTLVNNLVRNA